MIARMTVAARSTRVSFVAWRPLGSNERFAALSD